MGRGLERVFTRIESWTDPVPEPVLGLAVLALAAVFVVATLTDRRRAHSVGDDTPARPAASTDGTSCHDHQSQP